MSGSLGFPSNPYSLASTGSSESYSTSVLESLMNKRDYEAIINDKDLFMIAFFKSQKPTEESTSYLKTSLEDKTISVESLPGNIRVLKRAVEEVRQYILEARTDKSPSLDVIVFDWCHQVYIGKAGSKIDITQGKRGLMLPDMSKEVFLPPIKSLFSNIGISCQEFTKPVSFKTYSGDDTAPMKIFHLVFSQKDFYAYPIEPKEIKETGDVKGDLYKMQQDQLFCDFKLTSREGTIELHSNILFLNGGPVIQSMMRSTMKEGREKAISFTEYSTGAIKEFIQYLYIGGKAFSDGYISSHHEVNVYELLDFAHKLQISTLVDCCTNIISQLTDKDDVQDIERLAELYGNPHLKQLAEYFKGGTFYD